LLPPILVVPPLLLLPFDLGLSKGITGAGGETVLGIAQVFSRLGKLEWSTFCVALMFFAASRCWTDEKRKKFSQLAKGCVIAGVLAGIAVWPGKMLLGRERPSAESTGELTWAKAGLIGKNRYHSMPSGHASTSFASMTACVILYPPSAIVLTPIAITTGWSRVKLQKHWPSDVLAGWMLGGVIGFFTAQTLKGRSRVEEEKSLPLPVALSQD
jgi:membrane-associated phospholipid phosphatase